MMQTLSVTEMDARYVWHPFTQAAISPPPIDIRSASGIMLHGADGRDYMDLVSSWWVNLHGHAQPDIAAAIAQQASTLEQVIFADFTHAPASRLAYRLAAHLPGQLERVFFSDDGSTAVEVALKMARQYWLNCGQDRRSYIAFDGGYHGDTVGAMSMGHSSGYFGAWENMLFPVHVVPFPTTWLDDSCPEQAEQTALDALDKILAQHGNDIAAALIEPLVQGASGMRMCRPHFLRQLQDRLRQYGILLAVDEVMTGFGRTGAMFASAKAGIEPDLMCLSKGLTGGFLPMSVTIATPEIYDSFLGTDLSRAFLHGHSYTANPLGCAAGLASLDLLESPHCQQRIAAIETIHRHFLAQISAIPGIRHPRLCGTIAAVTLPGNGYESAIGPRLKQEFLSRGMLLRPLGNVLYLLPPYCITDQQLTNAWDCVVDVLGQNIARLSPLAHQDSA